MKPEDRIAQSRLDVRILKALAPFAGKDETRYYLNGVFVEIEPRSVTYAVTDGHRLVAYRDGLFDDTNENGVVGSFIIPTAQCKAFKIKKDDLTAASLTLADDKRLTLTFYGLGLTFQPIDGTYPDWRGTVPPKPNAMDIGQFNGEFVASFSKLAKELGLPAPFIVHGGVAKPAVVRFGNDERVFGVIMSMRVDGGTLAAPSWGQRRMAAAA